MNQRERGLACNVLLGSLMSVQERPYLRPYLDGGESAEPCEAVPVMDHVREAEHARQLEAAKVELRKTIAERDELAQKHKRAMAKIEDMHRTALTRPEVAEMVEAIEQSLVALCSVNIGKCERSRQILCGVHELLQRARLDQGAAGPLPAARIGWEAALRAYYAACTPRELAVVERFD